MNYETLLRELEEIATQLGIQVRYEKGDFEGGYCVLKDQKTLVVNKRLFDNRKTSVLAQGIAEFGLNTVYIKPAVRRFIEDELAKAEKETRK